MAELTTLETKLAEVMGLAMAAKAATSRLRTLVEDEAIQRQLERMGAAAGETERRCAVLVSWFDGKKTAIKEEARATKAKAADMMAIYLGDDADALDGFEFLTMAKAGEVGHWAILGALGEDAGHTGVVKLVQWALPIEERHFEEARRASLRLCRSSPPAS